ncbi:hypothetical protein CEXT_452631 [Caerostris extrusa]|uniref:Uncharacterized protein n=1 Tax=Caerostris extrusa TaxID=172846 RepID=A0AAV4PG92_CAEEX|nr:hypothetical protein CEXT_452631 [Caerostris extrusa]
MPNVNRASHCGATCSSWSTQTTLQPQRHKKHSLSVSHEGRGNKRDVHYRNDCSLECLPPDGFIAFRWEGCRKRMRFPPSRVRAQNSRKRYHERHFSSPDRLPVKRREPSCQSPTTAELSAANGLLGRCSGFAGQCQPDQRSG